MTVLLKKETRTNKTNVRAFLSLESYDRSCYCQVVNTPSTKKKRPRADEPRPSKGEASRTTILLAAAKLATTRGLDGLSIGDLAAEVGMSKSGLYAHFKSKEELELATIETAAAIFETEVLQPAARAHAGTERLRALVDAFLSHLERKVYPGGCFFAAVASELDTRPGPARDRVVQMLDTWLSLLRQCILDAQASGEIDPKAEVAQAVFEIQAMLLAGNYQFVMTNDPIRLTQARQGVEHVLARLAVREEPKKKR
jgi:AcrR family transcriptional regulator